MNHGEAKACPSWLSAVKPGSAANVDSMIRQFKNGTGQGTMLRKEMGKVRIPGRAVKCGATFALVPLKEIYKREIKLVKTGKYILIDGEEKPVYEKFNWDECPKIDQMFDDLYVEEHRLEDFLMENVMNRILMGMDC